MQRRGFRGEMDTSCCGWDMITENSEGERSTQGNTQGEHFPQRHWLGKQEGLDFMSSCNQRGLKQGVLKVSGLTRIEPGKHCTIHEEKGDKKPRVGGRQHGNRDLKNAFWTQGRDYLLV